MKETMNLCALWKHDVQWEKMTTKQKTISIWFALSFALLLISSECVSLLVVAVINFVASARAVTKNVQIKE